MSQSIQVSFVQEGDVYTVHTGSSVLKDIIMDYTGAVSYTHLTLPTICSV